MKQSPHIFNGLTFISEPKLKEEILDKGVLKTSEKGDVIVREGEFVHVLPIVIEGAIRVFQTREEREILLYYVEPSQTCMMSLSASFFDHSSAIQAIAVEPTLILTIPVKYISEWQTKYKSWNNFVIKTFRKRYDELLDAYERVAFNPINKRVIDYLNYRTVDISEYERIETLELSCPQEE